jgi:hypothetical protein
MQWGDDRTAGDLRSSPRSLRAGRGAMKAGEKDKERDFRNFTELLNSTIAFAFLFNTRGWMHVAMHGHATGNGMMKALQETCARLQQPAYGGQGASAEFGCAMHAGVI